MQQSPSVANSSSASQEIPWILLKPKFHFLSQTNPIHAVPSHMFNIHKNHTAQ
jgi:hypothetical protein